MNLTLTRKARKETGIFGELHTEDGKFVAFTLEHSYFQSQPSMSANGGVIQSWEAKIPLGTYRCLLGDHQLHSGSKFKTFMVTGVPNHSGILFHIGNYNRDSEGCILLGLQEIPEGVGRSGDAFKQFIALQGDRTEFFLNVES